jgi:ADP-dependent NAD(P)H-hydrate dehydratase / NAD(P)H-hydrate epimerase
MDFDDSPHALLSAAQIRQIEKQAFTDRLSADTLMARAGATAAEIIMRHYRRGNVLILCGTGRNGGDGFVVAEIMRQAGWPVTCAMLSPDQASLDEAVANARMAWPQPILPWSPELLRHKTLIVDALFGIGLDRALAPELINLIEQVNRSTCPVVALDLPSGVHADTGAILGAAIHAEMTICFIRKKIGLYLLPARDKAGKIILADLGLPAKIWSTSPATIAENHPDLWRHALPSFDAAQHKYDHGHALILGGAVMTGAARLAARAAQRTGAGLVTIASPPEATLIYASNLDSVLVQSLSGLQDWQSLLGDERKTAMLLGPGAGVSELLRDCVLQSLQHDKPVVLDADALTACAQMPEILIKALRPTTILTPHSGEFARLFGAQQNLSDKLGVVTRMARWAQCVILLKGADTVIAAPDGRAVINSNAPPWLATAGSGDVLAGIITGLVAQGVESFTAAAIAAWLHGRAAQDFSVGMIAEDLIAALPKISHEVRG